MNFIAIDFETANSKRSSACSLGLVVFEKNKAVFEKEWLINPYPNYYDDFNTRLHGISTKQTKDAPSFNEIWQEVSPLVRGQVIIAHNAAFDMSVIRSALDCYDTEYDRFDYLCTYLLAQSVYPNLGSYRLNMLCQKFGIPLNHHMALDDARAAGELFVRLAVEKDLKDFKESRSKLGVRIGKMYANDYMTCRILNPDRQQQGDLSVSEINDLDVIYEDSDFVGKNFVFTGTLLSMTRNTAMKLVSQAGGTAQAGITKDTNYLVTGIQDLSVLKEGFTQSSKELKAIALAEKGQNIQIITEDDFLNMVDEELLEIFLFPSLATK